MHLSVVSSMYNKLSQLNNKKAEKPNLTMNKCVEETLLQRRYTNVEQVHGKMLNLISH